MALNTSIPNPNVTSDTSFFQRFAAARAQVVTCPWDSTKKVYLLEIRSGEFTLNADRPGTGQPNGKNRTEALIGNSKVSPNFGFDPQEGDDTWMRWAIMVPTSSDDFGGRTGSDNVIMSQSNSYDSNHHGPGLTARFQTGAQQWVSYDGPTVYTLPKAQFTKGKVFDYMVHTHWSIGSSGYQEMWVKQTDGSWLQTSQGRVSGATLVQTNETTPRVGVYAKFGMYHQDPAAGGPWQLYHTGIRVGSARADVESLDLGTGGGVIVNPPPPPPVTRKAISTFLDAFNTTSRNQTLWPTVSGTPTFSNGQAVFLPTAAATQQFLTSAAEWQMEGGTLEFRIPTPAAPAAGTVTVETRVVVYQDPVANSSVVVKVLRSTADPTGQLWVIFVNNGVEDTSLPLATGITYNAATMLYGRIVVDSAGEVVTVATSPDKTTWTTRRTGDPAWSFAGAAAQVQVGARITSGTGSVTAAAFDEVGTVPFVPAAAAAGDERRDVEAADRVDAGRRDRGAARRGGACREHLEPRLVAVPGHHGDGKRRPVRAGIVTDTVRMWVFAKRYEPGVDTADWTVNLDASTTWSSNTFRISGADSLAADLGIAAVAAMSKNTAATSFVTDPLDSPGDGSRLYILAARCRARGISGPLRPG
jgi:hypothetical protein